MLKSLCVPSDVTSEGKKKGICSGTCLPPAPPPDVTSAGGKTGMDWQKFNPEEFSLKEINQILKKVS